MFAGKSSHLIRTVWGFRAINTPMFIIKHNADTRYDSHKISSHNRLTSEECVTSSLLMPLLGDPQYKPAKVVIIDEAQFFPDLVQFVKHVSDNDKKNVIVYGLNGDFERKPFQNISEIQSLANEIEKLKAYCCFCNDSTLADFTLRTSNAKEQVVVGADDIYKPVCRKHYLEYNNNH
jgi:thymidine kinase